jgi:EAL domain-containing protein (putative c-di-GMP-specific phosphodiesterase class I)
LRWLELESTESLLQNPRVKTVLDALRTLGARIGIDDFGTGYSSLGYLKRFSIGSLKIDSHLCREHPRTRINAAIVKAIVSIAHSLTSEVTAEGVKTPEQLAFVRSLDCDAVQDYLVSGPLSAANLIRLLSNSGSYFSD